MKLQLLDAREAFGPLVTAGFAACVAGAATETWILRFANADAGTEDARGMAAQAAALAIVALSIARVLGLIDGRRFLAVASALAVVALAMPLWVWATPVGNLDPAQGKPSLDNYTVPGMRVHGSTGLWMTIVAGLGLAASLACQWRTTLRQLTPTTALRPSVAAAFALFAALGALSPWIYGWRWSELGVESTAGLVALAAALEALILCALRMHDRVSERAFLWLSAMAAGLLVAAPVWALAATVGEPDPAVQRLLLGCFGSCSTIHAASGLYLSLGAALGFSAAIVIPALGIGRSSTEEPSASSLTIDHKPA
jgi:hypothetical protein